MTLVDFKLTPEGFSGSARTLAEIYVCQRTIGVNYDIIVA